MGEALGYIRLLARVGADNTVRRIRTQLRDRSARFDGTEPPAAWAELVGADDRLLLRWPVTGASECVMRTGRLPDVQLRAHVPLPAGTRAIRLVREGVVLHELPVAAAPPRAELSWPPRGARLITGRHKIVWRSSTAGADAFLRYSADDGRRWQRLGGRSADGRPFQADFDALPGGEQCRLALVVTAGCRSATVASARFRVPEKSPRLTLITPTDGTVLPARSPSLLEASVAHHFGTPGEPAAASIVWRSDRDGELGRGAVVWALLSAGTHQLSVGFADAVAATSTSVAVVVR
jgi:hypothetical protein